MFDDDNSVSTGGGETETKPGGFLEAVVVWDPSQSQQDIKPDIGFALDRIPMRRAPTNANAILPQNRLLPSTFDTSAPWATISVSLTPDNDLKSVSIKLEEPLPTETPAQPKASTVPPPSPSTSTLVKHTHAANYWYAPNPFTKRGYNSTSSNNDPASANPKIHASPTHDQSSSDSSSGIPSLISIDPFQIQNKVPAVSPQRPFSRHSLVQFPKSPRLTKAQIYRDSNGRPICYNSYCHGSHFYWQCPFNRPHFPPVKQEFQNLAASSPPTQVAKTKVPKPRKYRSRPKRLARRDLERAQLEANQTNTDAIDAVPGSVSISLIVAEDVKPLINNL